MGSRLLTAIGLSLTLLYFLGIGFLVFDDIAKIASLRLNELGDFLTGVFGPIAVFWLVLGYFQQGRELSLSVRAMELQADELKHSVEQQTRIAELTHQQLEHEFSRFRDEQVSRSKLERGAFIVTHEGNYTRLDGETEQLVSVVNLGQTVANFSFLPVHGLQPISSEMYEDCEGEIVFPVWERHRGGRFTYVVSEIVDQNQPCISMSYTNLDGTHVEREFFARFVEQNGFTHLEIFEGEESNKSNRR